MIRPAAFGFNEETAVNNFFQSDPGTGKEQIQELALREFDSMVEALQKQDISVLVINDTRHPPASLLPNPKSLPSFSIGVNGSMV